MLFALQSGVLVPTQISCELEIKNLHAEGYRNISESVQVFAFFGKRNYVCLMEA